MDNPFLGQYTRKTQKVRRWGDEVWKVESMVKSGTMTRQYDILVEEFYLRVTHLLGWNVNHQGETGKIA